MSFQNTFAQSKQFALNGFKNDHPKYKNKQVSKILWFTCLHYPQVKKWYETLQSEENKEIFSHRNRLYVKPFRVYMSTKWNIKQRMKVILDSYHFLNENGLSEVWKNDDIQLFSFPLKEDVIINVSIGYDERFRKEGEVSLFLSCENFGGRIVGASISFEKLNHGKYCCRIGCVQGHKEIDSKTYKIIQKLMHGLRPKALMVYVIQMLCQKLNIEELYGAGDGIQAYRKKHAIHIPFLHKIEFQYNDLWEEAGGKLQKDGWFALPIIPKRREIEELKSCKRAYYRRRYELENQIKAIITERELWF